jgi:hypothetical protein
MHRKSNNTPAPAPTLRFITASVPDRLQALDRVIFGPAVLGVGEGISFDQQTHLMDHEVAVCYLDNGVDWAHGKAHWAAGPVPEVSRWLLDEAAVSPRRRGLIAAIAIREMWRRAGLPEDIRGPLEHSVVEAVDPG